MNILVLNAGSSSLKYKIFRITDDSETVLDSGNADHSGGDTIAKAAEEVIENSRSFGIDAIGHRLVHGGPKFLDPVRITPEIVSALHELAPLDPLHNPSETAMVETGMRLLPDVPSIAVFDTSFHKTLPEYASRYAIPSNLSEGLSLRRYGFHGISYQYVSRLLLESMGIEANGSKLIVCHLGSGASICALKDGKSIDTSMGLTPLEGLVMGTRSGDIDPGLLLYLMREEKMTVEDIDTILNKQSGLMGVSEISADVRELEKTRDTDRNAHLALEMFAYRVRKYIGAYAASLGGVDAIAFTGGIGEHSSAIRRDALQGLDFLGIEIDLARNESLSGKEPVNISRQESRVQVWVVPTDEELQIAREVFNLLLEPKKSQQIETLVSARA